MRRSVAWPWDDLLHHDKQGVSGNPTGRQSPLEDFDMRIGRLEDVASDARLTCFFSTRPRICAASVRPPETPKLGNPLQTLKIEMAAFASRRALRNPG
jgi:hypothetical protein